MSVPEGDHRPAPARIDALPAFTGAGIELEYMIVDRASLDVRPLALALLTRLAGEPASSVEHGAFGWSNELVAHVVEVKNTQPDAALDAMVAGFEGEVAQAIAALGARGATLLPTGMHPWMDPGRETSLWAFDHAELYATFDRIFDCRRHGWANLQSMHVNLPFAGDAQFARLHAAIRLVLPLVPALAASSPFVEGSASGLVDSRLSAYQTNSERIPAITGATIPDASDTRAQYERDVLEPIYEGVAPHDPAGILRHEWLNARGAIPRFDRSAIEIRLADTQECPRADLAVAAALVAVLRGLYEERWSSHAMQREVPTPLLASLLSRTIERGEDATIDASDYLATLGLARPRPTAGEVWLDLFDACSNVPLLRAFDGALDVWKRHGTLARRILKASGPKPSRTRLHDVYAALGESLANGRAFVP